MTAICRGGTSSAQPGYGLSLYMGSGALGVLLNNVATRLAVPYAALLAGTTFVLANVCNTDPPADPGFTSTDANHLLKLDDPEGVRIATAKLVQLAQRNLWYQVCKCDDGLPPTAQAAPVFPADLPQINPAVGTPLPSLNCGEIRYRSQNQGGYYGSAYDGLSVNGPNAAPSTIPPARLPESTRPVTFTFEIQRDPASGTDGIMTCREVWYDNGNNIITSIYHPGIAAGGYQTFTATQPANANNLNVLTNNNNNLDYSYYQVHVTKFCNGTLPTGIQSACCPPDPTLQMRIDQIMQMVTLLQRQLAPFAYVQGATHPGLSGTGHIGVHGLLGCKVAITAMPGYLGQDGVLPVEIFDLGWLTWNTLDGYPSSVRIDHNPFLSLPARCSAYTDIAYDLSPGVTATITELVREP